MKTNGWIVKILITTGCFLATTLSGLAQTDALFPEEITQGVMIVPNYERGGGLPLPIERTSVRADVTGFMARVEVEQHFGNPFPDAIEAVYLFPLPPNAAVDAMTLTIGSRTIRGVIKTREDAQRIYQRARAEGRTASLLTQERPNIFTQSVANILPGDAIVVKISYVQDIAYDDGTYTFNFPMVVGPRFIPGNPIGRAGSGFSPDTDRVPDASRITPHVLPPEVRSGHDIDLELTIDAGLAIRALRCPSHSIRIDRSGPSSARVVLDPLDSIPNKDFILKYDVAGESPEAAILTHSGDMGGFFTLMIQPQDDFVADDVTPKELIFVVDCSGSMNGAPLNLAKAAMKQAISGMNRDDSFQIIQFSQSASSFAPFPIPNTPQNVRRGLAFIDAMHSEGGTQMIEGIRAALAFPKDSNRMRMVLFMTDGYIGNEREILADIKRRIGDARLFSFGVGTSVNHYLLDSMAQAGRGFVQYVRPDEDTTSAVQRFYDRINNPLLTDISIDWKQLDVRDVYPAVVPDLFSTQPVIVHGRFETPGKAEIVLSGFLGGTPWKLSLPVTFSTERNEHDVLGTLWARSRIESLMNLQHGGERLDVRDEIIQTALRFRIMSQYTAFVAVSDEVRRNPEDRMETVEVPVEIPEMVSHEGVFGVEDTVKRKQSGMPIAPVAPMCKQSSAFADELVLKEEETRVGSEFDAKGDVSALKQEEKSIDQDGKIQRSEVPAIRTEITVRSTAGGIDQRDVQKAIDTVLLKLTELLRAKGQGKVVLIVTVGQTGSIDRVEIVESSWQDSDLETHICDALKAMAGLPSGPGTFSIEIRSK